MDGFIWKMNKRVYRFCDTPRGFYLELSKTLKELWCKKSIFDPALFLWWDSKGHLEEADNADVVSLEEHLYEKQIDTKFRILENKIESGNEDICESSISKKFLQGKLVIA